MSTTMMKVSPTITDPMMKAPVEEPTEAMLKEMGAESTEFDDLRKTVLEPKDKKTKEEQISAPETSVNKMLILVFALIVIALIALVVWMVMRQNEAEKQEEAMTRARLQPHKRNNMPPTTQSQHQSNQQQYTQVHQQHNQQHANSSMPKPDKAHIEEVVETAEDVEAKKDDQIVNRVQQAAAQDTGAALLANLQSELNTQNNSKTQDDQQVSQDPASVELTAEDDEKMVSRLMEEVEERAKDA